MISLIKPVVKVVLLVALIAIPLSFIGTESSEVLAQDNSSSVIGGVNVTGSDPADPTGQRTLNRAITTTITVLTWVVGVLAVIMIIANGFRIILAQGDSSKVASARTGIIYALIGITVVVFAQVLVNFAFRAAVPAMINHSISNVE